MPHEYRTKNYTLGYIIRSVIIFYRYCQLLRFFAFYSAESIANKSYADHLFINIRAIHDWFVNNDIYSRGRKLRKNIRLIFLAVSTVCVCVCVENRDKAQREAAFYSAGACENTTPRESRKYSNTRVSRRQPLGSVVTCPVIYGCNTAATLLFVVFTHISRSPAGRDRNASARAHPKHRGMRSRGDIRELKHWRDEKKRKTKRRTAGWGTGWRGRRERE